MTRIDLVATLYEYAPPSLRYSLLLPCAITAAIVISASNFRTRDAPRRVRLRIRALLNALPNAPLMRDLYAARKLTRLESATLVRGGDISLVFPLTSISLPVSIPFYFSSRGGERRKCIKPFFQRAERRREETEGPPREEGGGKRRDESAGEDEETEEKGSIR